MLVKIYTDGAARGNPDGPGGYGTVLRDIKKYIESMLTPTHINDAIVGDNSRLKDKNKKLKAALIEAKNIIEEALKDEPISSHN